MSLREESQDARSMLAFIGRPKSLAMLPVAASDLVKLEQDSNTPNGHQARLCFMSDSSVCVPNVLF